MSALGQGECQYIENKQLHYTKLFAYCIILASIFELGFLV